MSDGWVTSAIGDAARRPRPVWGSPRAYVLATITGVVGLGNLWRYPYMAGQHGGGSFLVANLVCVVLMAIPLAALESSAGKLSRSSPVGTFRQAAGRWGAAVGWTVVGMTVAIMSYYLVVTGWTLGYFVDALRGELQTFGDFTQGHASLWLFLVIGVVVLLVLLRGVTAIEKSSYVVMPLLLVIVVGLAIYGQTLEGAGEARSFYLGVSGEHLLDPATWRAAAGQSFYSVGVGQGLLMAYASFVPAGTNIIKSSTTIALTNAAVSIVSALMVFAFVFTFDISPSTGSELSFTAFPLAFEEVPGGALLAVAFFFLLFLAGFTSCLGGALVVFSTVGDELGFNRRRAALLTVGLLVLFGVPSAISFTDIGLDVGGEPFLDRVDQLAGAGIILVLGLGGAALLARKLPRRALAATFGASTVRLGRYRLGPGTVIGWVALLPVGVVALLALSSIL